MLASNQPHMWILISDIAGVWEIADSLGVSRATVNRWIERRDQTGFPAPVCKLHGLHVYDLSQCREWFEIWRITRAGYYNCG